MKKLQVKLLTVSVSAAMLSLFAAGSAQAQTCALPSANFAIAVNVQSTPPTCGTLGTSTAQAFFDALNTSGLHAIAPSFTSTTNATVVGNFNSVPMNLSVTGNAYSISIPAIGIPTTVFNSKPTRDQNQQDLEDFIKKQNNVIGRIMQYQAANSPTSPISGPGGLIPTVTANDFNSNFTDSATNIAAPASVAAQAKGGANLVGIALQYGQFDVSDSKVKTTTIPLSYTIRNEIDPRRQLTFSLPITEIDTNGAKSYQAGLGVGYRVPLNDHWTLTPAGRFSAVGSEDMATVATLYSVSLTSTYIWNLANFDIAMGNMISYNKTGKFKAGDYDVDPNISNTVFRNGVMLSQPVTLAGKKMSIEYSLIDTRYTGTTVYVDNTQEVGITLGTNKSAFSARSYLRGGVSYIHGKDTKGFTLNLGYWF